MSLEQKRNKLIDLMRYNLAEGNHTQHRCKCGRWTRCDKCACCQADELRGIEAEIKIKDESNE